MLGLEPRYDYTPRMYRRIVFAAAQGVSFAEASEVLRELGELPLLPKRVWRAAIRIGEERVAEGRAAAQRYEQLPLPEQQRSPHELVPQVVCVQMDGGRFQERSRALAEASTAVTNTNRTSQDDSSWREFKAGCLLTLSSAEYAEDPCPQLPATFADPGHMRQMAREIKGFTHESAVALPAAEETDEETEPNFQKRPGRPEMLVKSVVATCGDVVAFGPLLAAAAYERGFPAAPRKAFVADGAACNWGVWRKFFSHYTPILDFVHALMYVYSAALAGRTADEGWAVYHEWAQWLWSGEVDRLLAALRERQQELGLPAQDEAGTPRAQVASSLGYLTHQRERMRYHEYRQQGLPITSSAIEATVKQINRRIKGSEKFWDAGADPMLHLVADRLSQTNALPDFWSRRTQRLIESACYQQGI